MHLYGILFPPLRNVYNLKVFQRVWTRIGHHQVVFLGRTATLCSQLRISMYDFLSVISNACLRNVFSVLLVRRSCFVLLDVSL
jgi:hypothetical protein